MIRGDRNGGSVLECDLLTIGGGVFAGYRNLFYDLDVEPLKRGDVRGGVREQADLVDAEVSENLAAETYLAEDALVLVILRGAGFTVEEDAVRLDGAIDVEAAAGVVKVDEGTASGFGDETQGLSHQAMAVAGGSGEDVSREAVRMDANEHGIVAQGLVGTDVTSDQRKMALAAVDFALVGDDAEFSIGRGEHAFGDAENIALVLQAVTNELGHGEHLEAVLCTELLEVGDAGHRTVIVHDLADDSGGNEAGETGEINGSFGLSGTNEDAAAAGAQRKDMSRTG
jgi:hypothetical protein